MTLGRDKENEEDAEENSAHLSLQVKVKKGLGADRYGVQSHTQRKFMLVK